jgi:hypothetical protein
MLLHDRASDLHALCALINGSVVKLNLWERRTGKQGEHDVPHELLITFTIKEPN